jgi:hypothetical protein
VREAVENNKVKPEYLPSANLMADLFTKPLPGPRTKSLREIIKLLD